jgi:hypothetical protein
MSAADRASRGPDPKSRLSAFSIFGLCDAERLAQASGGARNGAALRIE